MCTKEISGTCVDTKPRGIEATCIVSGDRRRSCIISYNKQQNFDGVCLYVFTNDRANPKPHCQNNTHYETFTRRKTRGYCTCNSCKWDMKIRCCYELLRAKKEIPSCTNKQTSYNQTSRYFLGSCVRER